VADKKKGLRKADKVDKLERFAHFLEPQKKEELSAAKLTMLRAGYTGKNAVRMFHAIQFLLAILFLIVGLIIALVKSFSQEMSMTDLLLHSLLPCAIGYYLPRYWVNRRVNQRQTEIIQGFPDALDLMLVCVEAGQSLDQSIIRVGKESRVGYPALADEFDLVAQEVKAGKERISVLKDMAERVGVPDVASFVTTIIQSATFGTSIADALRVYSADMRDKRIMRAEEKANMLPTKLTLGTMLFTVPPLLVILIGPSIYGMVTMLGQLAGGL
jgi:tight adherence protein C